ncbi:MAG: serine O-acetyltransferase [Gammaproteobacteria bacterium]
MFKALREDIRCIFERDPAARNAFEVLTTYPGLHAVILYRASNRLWRWRLKWLARFLALFNRWLTGIEIHPAAQLGRRFFIDHGMGVVIGETARIGDDCTIYHGVTLGGTSWGKGKRHPTLCNNVVVGAGAKVLGPIVVGEGARIGSNAVAVRNVPPGSTVVGIPGHVVPKRDDTQRDRQAIAEKIGFDAYGLTQSLPDPVADAINRMLDHIHAVDREMAVMRDAINRLGGRVEALALPDLEPCQIDSNSPPADTQQKVAAGDK